MYNDALTEKMSYGDSRTHHTKNKKTLLQMFDDISDTPNVIAIYTSEKSYSNLYSIKSSDKTDYKYRSFMRKGRINLVIHLEEKKAILEKLT